MASMDDTEMDNENENDVSVGVYSNVVTGPSGATTGSLSTYNPDFEVTNPSIDLDMYVSGYTGLMRINRLVFLAEHCPTLRIDALRLAINYIMETYNTNLYMSVHKQLTDAYNSL